MRIVLGMFKHRFLNIVLKQNNPYAAPATVSESSFARIFLYLIATECKFGKAQIIPHKPGDRPCIKTLGHTAG